MLQFRNRQSAKVVSSGGKLSRMWRLIALPEPLRPCDKAPRAVRRGAFALLGVLAVALAEILSHFPVLVERGYTEAIGHRLVRALAAASAFSPISLVEIVLLGLSLYVAAPAAAAAWHVLMRTRHLRNALVCGVFRAAALAGVLVATFYVLWGFNYARAPFVVRAGWTEPWEVGAPLAISRDELTRLCAELVFATNHYYLAFAGTEDLGRPSAPPCSMTDLDLRLDAGYARLARTLGLGPAMADRRGRSKPVLSSRLLSELGIAGFYFPYTGEANYNADMPPCQRPFTIAHEKAHQRCVTSEDEANFLGYLACSMSDEPYARYSGYLFAQRQLLNELMRVDRHRAEALLRWQLPGVQRDVNTIKLFWSQYRGPTQSVSLAVNHMYLKANRVAGGVASYRMSARLLVLYARNNGGTCLPDAGGSEEVRISSKRG